MFRNIIRERGYDYYKEGRVVSIQLIDDIYKAVVNGREQYHVEIKFDNDFRVTHMSCDCPYALESHNCKHEVAVLIELLGAEKVLGYDPEVDDEDDYYDEYDDYYDGYEDYDDYEEYHHEYKMYESGTLMSWLEDKSKDQILLLIEELINDDHIYQSINNIKEQQERSQRIHNELSKISNNFFDKINDVHHLIDELIVHHQIKEALSQIQYVLLTMLKHDYFNEFEEEIAFNLFKQLESYYDEYKDDIRSYEKALCINHNYQFIDQILKYIYQRDKNINHILDDLQDHLKNKEYIEPFIHIASLYDENRIMNIDINTLSYDHQILFIQYLINYNYLEYALKLTRNRVKSPLHNHLLIEKELEILKILGKTDEVKELNKRLLFEIKPGNIDRYIKYSECFNKEDWNNEKHKVLNQLKQKNIDICDIYIYEKKYKQLMNWLIKNNDILRIKKYESVLMIHCKNELINIYKDYIFNALKKTNNRKYYQEIALYLKTIALMNKKEAKQIFKDLEYIYPSRHVMIEELHKVINN